MPERVWVVEDDTALRNLLLEVTKDAGYESAGFHSADAALRAIDAGERVDLVITDLMMPGLSGQEFLAQLRTRRSELNVVIITAFGSIESAIELVKAGAYDYLTKPLSTEDLLQAVEAGLVESRARREVARLLQAGAGAPPGFVGASRSMQDLFRLMARVAHSRHPVVISGESGTGKELVARALHQSSGRGAFIPVNCGALPENLLESELFGHEKGAFTGADRSRAGLFEAAQGGTLFLDEIGELPLALQPKLLRALEQGEIRRVGSTEPRRLDVRIIAATNRDLEDEVREGRFRDDLFWRLNVLHLLVPALRERPEDIPLLAQHFLDRAAEEPGSPRLERRLSPEAMAVLRSYPWPGNVRELRNAIEQAATLSPGTQLRPEDLPRRIAEGGRAGTLVTEASQRGLRLRDLERRYILDVLQQAGGNKSRAAEILGLDRKTLYRKLQEYRQEEPDALS